MIRKSQTQDNPSTPSIRFRPTVGHRLRKTVCAALAAAVVIAGAPAAFAFEELAAGITLPPMPKPTPKPVGYKWIALSNGHPGYWAEKIAEEDGIETFKNSDGCQWAKAAGDSFAYSVRWDWCNGASGSAKVEMTGSPWPLSKGATWTSKIEGFSDRSGNYWDTELRCKVADAVRVRVQAGEFDTYKVVCTDTWNVRTRYYAPEIQATVYSVREHSSRSGRWEFVRQEFPDGKR